MRLGIGLGLFKQGAVSVGVRLFSAYKSRVIADGGITEADNCGISALNNGLFRQASLLLIPSGYKSGKAYAEIPTNGNGDLTWTRASTALRTNSSGLLESMGSGVPRLSYMYGSCPALLLEPQRTNLALRSQEFDNASWIKNGASVTANSTTSPDGETNADTVTSSASNGFVYQTFSATAVTTYTFSVWVKAVSSNVTFELNLYSNGSGLTIATSIVTATGTWQRVSVSGTYALASANAWITIGGNSSFSTGESIYVYGAQLEAGAYPTTYIPTTTASATRIADSFSRNNIYTNGLITSAGGTWFVELRGNTAYTADTTVGGFFVDSANFGYTNGFLFRKLSSGRIVIQKYIATIGTTLYTTTTDTTKVAIKWNGSTADVFANGTKVVSATSFTPTAMEFLSNNTIPLMAFIQASALFTTPQTDQFCQDITTL